MTVKSDTVTSQRLTPGTVGSAFGLRLSVFSEILPSRTTEMVSVEMGELMCNRSFLATLSSRDRNQFTQAAWRSNEDRDVRITSKAASRPRIVQMSSRLAT